MKIEEWCKEKFEGKPEYSRRTPNREADDPREKTLGSALRHFKKKPIWINYQKGKKEGLSREKIKQKYELREEQIKLVERYERLIEEYDYWELNTSADNIMKIEKWCKEEFEGKPEYSRRTPNTTAKDPREKILGNALSRFKQNRIWTDYQKGKEEGLSRKEIKQKYELREGQIKLVERYERLIEEYDLDDYLKNVMKIEEWCKEKFEGMPEYSRRTPRMGIAGVNVAQKEEQETEEQRELRLGKALSHFKQTPMWTDYQKGKKEGLSREEIKRKYGLREGEMQLVERYDRLIEEYGKKKKITGQDIGKASCTTNVQECDEAQANLSRLIQEQSTKEGGKEQDD